MPGESRNWEHNPLETHTSLKWKPDFSILVKILIGLFIWVVIEICQPYTSPVKLIWIVPVFLPWLNKGMIQLFIFSFTWRSWQRFRGVIKEGGSRKQTDENLRNTVEVDVRSFWAWVNFFFLLATCQELDCKSIFAYSCENAIEFEQRSTLAVTSLKQNFSCLHISLAFVFWPFLFVLFLSLSSFVCVFLYFQLALLKHFFFHWQ